MTTEFKHNSKHIAETGEILIAENAENRVTGKLSGKPPKFFAVNRNFDDQMLFMQAVQVSGRWGDADEIWDKVAQHALDEYRISEKVELKQTKEANSFIMQEFMDLLRENERLSKELAAARGEGK